MAYFSPTKMNKKMFALWMTCAWFYCCFHSPVFALDEKVHKKSIIDLTGMHLLVIPFGVV